ncbi:LLM class F420-dependent oxidoreductase [Nocardia sp.]|uniref:LLM class F420-dependent oxidoreductase n=1 Tax=Nocardia sp. TaxID=1821 RepID=UPI00261E3073|nr:LLM class F420-dependent oxidoreductase [Nocardia sp.]
MANEQFGKFGVWQPHSTVTPEAVRELEQLGYGTVWLGTSPPADWDGFDALFAASESISIGTSIVNMWSTPAKASADLFHRLESKFPGRFLLGIGAGHREFNDGYTKPYDALVNYLDELDEAGVPKNGRALAALGPKVATLARDRTAGALPYLTTPAHTADLRVLFGPDTLLAPEQKVVLEEDPQRARTIARERAGYYLNLANYVNNLRRYGFDDQDVTPPGSDRVIDAIAPHGTPDQIADAITAHLRAGADHVAIQVLGGDNLPALRTLAPLLAARAN